MVNVTIRFNDKDYILSCEQGQEQELEKLAVYLNQKFMRLKEDLGNIGENKLLLISSIQLIDELFTFKNLLEKMRNQNKDLIQKFKEIKNLAILFRDEKETQINNLHSELLTLKEKMSEDETSYANALEKVSHTIDIFLKKIN